MQLYINLTYSLGEFKLYRKIIYEVNQVPKYFSNSIVRPISFGLGSKAGLLGRPNVRPYLFWIITS